MTTNPTMVSEENGDEAHLWKVRGINAVIPRGLKIEEEEHLTLGKDNGASYFNNYERERSIKLFFKC